MEEKIEKFGSGRKIKRQNNKKERGHIKNLLKNYEEFDVDFNDQYSNDPYNEEDFEWKQAS